MPKASPLLYKAIYSSLPIYETYKLGRPCFLVRRHYSNPGRLGGQSSGEESRKTIPRAWRQGTGTTTTSAKLSSTAALYDDEKDEKQFIIFHLVPIIIASPTGQQEISRNRNLLTLIKRPTTNLGRDLLYFFKYAKIRRFSQPEDDVNLHSDGAIDRFLPPTSFFLGSKGNIIFLKKIYPTFQSINLSKKVDKVFALCVCGSRAYSRGSSLLVNCSDHLTPRNGTRPLFFPTQQDI